jgi:hypothetical protein
MELFKSLKNSFFNSLFIFILVNFTFGQEAKLLQAVYNGSEYEFGYQCIPEIEIKGAPQDVDWSNWSILHDGENYRLYFMPVGKKDRLYQFGYNPQTEKYEYAFNSIPVIRIKRIPKDADVSNFSILFDGEFYRLYLKSSTSYSLYQFAFKRSLFGRGSYVYGYKSISKIEILNAPEDINWKNWTMLHDRQVYRLYFKSKKEENKLIQFGFDGIAYNYGFKSSPSINIIGFPETNYKFNILHDGDKYRYYNLIKSK